uniref:Uncharacterized protein n=1 Tax=Leersia perrieri TaxID=77586 RepID=A0A0D9WTI7_9ORYZ
MESNRDTSTPPSRTVPLDMNFLMAIRTHPMKMMRATRPRQTPRTMAMRTLFPTSLDEVSSLTSVLLPQDTEIAMPHSFGFPMKLFGGNASNWPPIGIGPSRSLFATLKTARKFSLPSAGGIVPVRVFIFPNSGEIVPTMSLSLKLSVTATPDSW